MTKILKLIGAVISTIFISVFYWLPTLLLLLLSFFTDKKYKVKNNGLEVRSNFLGRRKIIKWKELSHGQELYSELVNIPTIVLKNGKVIRLENNKEIDLEKELIAQGIPYRIEKN